MNNSSFADQEGFGTGATPYFTCRVRNTIYLWGSASFTANLNFSRPPIIHIRNAKHGDDVVIGIVTTAGGSTTIATLQPGEMLSLEVQAVTGITATCATQSVVYCQIR